MCLALLEIPHRATYVWLWLYSPIINWKKKQHKWLAIIRCDIKYICHSVGYFQSSFCFLMLFLFIIGEAEAGLTSGRDLYSSLKCYLKKVCKCRCLCSILGQKDKQTLRKHHCPVQGMCSISIVSVLCSELLSLLLNQLQKRLGDAKCT